MVGPGDSCYWTGEEQDRPSRAETEGWAGVQDAPADLHTGGSVAHDVPHIPFLTALLEGLPP